MQSIKVIYLFFNYSTKVFYFYLSNLKLLNEIDFNINNHLILTQHHRLHTHFLHLGKLNLTMYSESLQKFYFHINIFTKIKFYTHKHLVCTTLQGFFF